ncbi:pseudouridine synthase [Caulobacter mirabilis]|uniref:Pseudouridine synthase n=1 Tax=Caulobacter mirabilis TaxID=69666 RepID=A0A2D2B221_9CAUL|nr:pseudouridine synthase [Caulobacter mirabilis]ATQ44291.1 23S rRNA pseudouridylate synthase B [Caulobacter mirabilis]
MAARPNSSDESADHQRVAKVLARAGVASRREVERLIEAGRVAINGQTLTTPAVKVEPGDILTVDGEVVAGAEPTRLFRYHKPVGLVTSHNDPGGRPTVFQNLPEGLPRVISIGRLDLNSEGLLLLTNDGELSRALEMPSAAWVRRYRVRAFGYATQERLDKLKDGVVVEGVRYGAIEAKLDKAVGDREGARNVWITVSLTEGKNREVRRVLESIGLKVNRLLRLSYGPFALGDLGAGDVEEVGPRVIRELLADVIPPENMPKGSAVQFKGAPGAGRRRPSGEAGGTPREADAAPRRALRPGQESGEIKGPRQPKKAGWAKAKPKLNPHAKKGAPAKKAWSEGPKGSRPSARADGPRPASTGKPAGPRGPRPAGKPAGKPSRPGGPGAGPKRRG